MDELLKQLDSPHHVGVAATRRAIDDARDVIRAGGDAPSLDSIVERATELIGQTERSYLRSVINATGVLVHTNLGRSPLGAAQLEAVAEIAGGYSNLEYSIEEGERGSRYVHAQSLINDLTGSEAALVVNNNAAAVLLMLAGLARNKEVIISRGELIEIGGEFRIPDVMEHAGVRLVEIGTTNRTHLADYERAITPDTAAILKVHPSNYKVVGFTSSVSSHDLARLAQGRRVYFLHDLGSGLISSEAGNAFDSEPTIAESLREGADLVTFSGDKLLGGPQAGVIAGRAELITKLSKHPLLRALRMGKLDLAALEATLRLYLEGRRAEIPLWAMAEASLETLEARARTISSQISSDGVKAQAVPVESVTGGGSLPGESLPSWAIAIESSERSADELERRLRYGSTPVIARIEDDRLLLDLRTVPKALDDLLTSLLAAATAPSSRSE